MKKKLSILFVLAIALFIGFKGVNALSIPGKISLETDESKSSTDTATRTKKTVVNIVFTPSQSLDLSGRTDTYVVKYNKPHEKSNFDYYDDGIASRTGNIEKTETGGSFTVSYSGNVTKGQKVTLFTLVFESDSSYNGSDCGGTVTTTSGGSNTDEGNRTVGPSNTGVSVPVAIIGIGAVTGLAIYSVSSRKTKMHRI